MLILLDLEFVLMKTTMQNVNLLVVTVVDLRSIHNSVHYACAMNIQIVMHQWIWFETEFAMMKPTVRDATMMVVIVVELVSTRNSVQNVLVMKNQHLTFHVSYLFK